MYMYATHLQWLGKLYMCYPVVVMPCGSNFLLDTSKQTLGVVLSDHDSIVETFKALK